MQGQFDTAEAIGQEAAPKQAHIAGNIRAEEEVAGQGTPQDFSSTVCNAGSPVGELQRLSTLQISSLPSHGPMHPVREWHRCYSNPE